jgi:uncharacterized membrane protein
MNYAGQALENRATANDAPGGRHAGLVLGAAVIATGLLAGLFYAFDVAVMPALTRADDRTLVDAMQQMIDAIENPAFFLTFLGAPVLAGVALAQARRSGSTETARWIMIGLGAYAVMFLVTVAFHFPLNEDMKNAGDPARIRDLEAVRDDFATPWVAWNIVRTVASTVAFGALTRALFVQGRPVTSPRPSSSMD